MLLRILSFILLSTTCLNALGAASVHSYLAKQYPAGSIAARWHEIEQEISTAESPEDAAQNLEKLSNLLRKNGRLQEAIWVDLRRGMDIRDQQAELVNILKNGEIEVLRRIDNEEFENGKVKGKTESWLLDIDLAEHGKVKALFKPRSADWDNQVFASSWNGPGKYNGECQPEREVSAFTADRIMGLDLVATTVFREGIVVNGKEKAGAVIYWLEDVLGEKHGYNIAEELWPGQFETCDRAKPREPVWRRLLTPAMRLFSFVIRNHDMHAANFLLLPGGKRVVIDFSISQRRRVGRKLGRWELVPTRENCQDYDPGPKERGRLGKLKREDFEPIRSDVITDEDVTETHQRLRTVLRLVEQSKENSDG